VRTPLDYESSEPERLPADGGRLWFILGLAVSLAATAGVLVMLAVDQQMTPFVSREQ
jgi:hypothetical protein